MSEADPPAALRWLLLFHQIPPKPAYLRVKTWRRLQSIGAVALKNAVYALPASAEALEDLQWLRREIIDGGGEASICEARLVDGITDDEARNLFLAARDADYGELIEEARRLNVEADDARTRLSRLRRRFEEIRRIDFFGGEGREAADGLLTEIEQKLGRGLAPMSEALSELKDRVWVTRRGVQVDRIASAWLIRRFIDPKARFKFVVPHGYVPKPGEIRFDTFEGEFTHEGDRCTFEVLALRFGRDDPALTAIAEIVHDIDLKDGKFGREEASGLALAFSGIAAGESADEARLEKGGSLLDGLYRHFGGRA
ncbi:MAG: chromate resistance protein [Alphaproteobacteria bacterium]|nr:chromate resistance protein [Alphaproteobacteria bacterium]